MWCPWGIRKSYVDALDGVLCLDDRMLVSCDSETFTHVVKHMLCQPKYTKKKL